MPTPAIVAPIEFSMRRADYEALGGHTEQIRSLREVLERGAWHNDGAPQARVADLPLANPWPLGRPPLLGWIEPHRECLPQAPVRRPLAFPA